MQNQSIETTRRVGRLAHGQLLEPDVGITETVNRYELSLLAKQVGREAGFTPAMLQLLDYYLAFTRDIDWEEGSRPIVFQSVSRTAMDFGISERQVQKLEQQLAAAGAITWNDSGNFKRYGRRNPKTGRIEFAFGVDLSPLAALRPQLEAMLETKRQRQRKWAELKRQITWYRGQIRLLLTELADQANGCHNDGEWQDEYQRIAIQIRSHIGNDKLEQLLIEHKALHEQLRAEVNRGESCEQTEDRACRSEEKFAHKESTTQQPSDESDTPARKNPWEAGRRVSLTGSTTPRFGDGKKETAAERKLAAGLQHISLEQILQVASPRFCDHLPLEDRNLGWNDIVEAAYQLRSQLQISQEHWADGCQLLGRTGAAVCVVLTDRGTFREDNRVTRPAGYFQAMLQRARKGDLQLHRSVFGLVSSARQAVSAN